MHLIENFTRNTWVIPVVEWELEPIVQRRGFYPGAPYARGSIRSLLESYQRL